MLAAQVSLELTDDQGVDQVAIWHGGEKVDWRQGNGESMQIDVDLEVYEGSQVITVEASDLDGAETMRRFYVRGLVTDDALLDGSEGED